MESPQIKISNRAIKLRYFGILSLWGIFVCFIIYAYFVFPYDSTEYDSQRHPGTGTLHYVLILMVLELVVLLFILRPHSYNKNLMRAVSAIFVFFPWAVFSAMVTTLAGGIIDIHAFWLLALSIVLTITLCWSIISSLSSRFGVKRT